MYIFAIQCYHTTIFTTYGRQPQTSHLNGMQRDPQKYQGTFRTLTFLWICNSSLLMPQRLPTDHIYEDIIVINIAVYVLLDHNCRKF